MIETKVISLVSELANKGIGRTVDSIRYEKIFRNPVDLKYINETVEKNINSGQKTNMALIGLGKSGIEPLTYLTQIFLTARQHGKKLDDVLGKVDFIDVQKSCEINHSREILNDIEKGGSEHLKYLFSGLAPKEKDEIYNKFLSLLKESDNKYLGHFLEDFVDNSVNHNKYDLTFCNNVFYYVGGGATPKYRYMIPGTLPEAFEYPGCYDRYYEVIKNLLSTTKKDGKLFFHHDVGKETNNKLTKDLKKVVSGLPNFTETEMNIVSKTN